MVPCGAVAACGTKLKVSVVRHQSPGGADHFPPRRAYETGPRIASDAEQRGRRVFATVQQVNIAAGRRSVPVGANRLDGSC